MAGLVQFGIMAAVVGLGVVGLRRPAKPGARRILVGVALTLVFLAANLLLSHNCGAGQPVRQALVSGSVLFLLIAFASPPKKRWILAAGTVVLGFTSGLHYTAVVHRYAGPSVVGYTGNPVWQASVAPGSETRWRWHTWVTGIYEVHVDPTESPPSAQAAPESPGQIDPRAPSPDTEDSEPSPPVLTPDREIHPLSPSGDMCLEMYSFCDSNGSEANRCTSAPFHLECDETGTIPGGDTVHCVCP